MDALLAVGRKKRVILVRMIYGVCGDKCRANCCSKFMTMNMFSLIGVARCGKL